MARGTIYIPIGPPGCGKSANDTLAVFRSASNKEKSDEG